MNILILNTQVPFCTGGAEILANDLNGQLQQAGHSSEIVTLPFKWYPQQSLVNSVLAAKLFDISSYNGKDVDRVIALKFPVWLMPHENKSFWILHQHRTAYDLWDSEFSDLAAMPEGALVRDLIRREDYSAISASDKVYTISRTVSDRLSRYSRLDSGVLYPPPRHMSSLQHRSYGDYFYFPSRITPVKRQELIIEAMAYVTEPVRVVFAGDADNPEYLQGLKKRAAEVDTVGSIDWLGRVDDAEHLSLYADALMVIFTPLDEDYGYVTPEAMLSGKAVLTVSDAGGATEFVAHEETGLIEEPDPALLGQAMSRVWQDRKLARLLGENAREAIAGVDFSWDNILEKLL
jgi:glycosyltransferase involved in cell wall biosynthesis